MLEQLVQPVKLELVVSRPSRDELGRFASKALHNQSNNYRYVWWEPSAKQDFVLQIYYLATFGLKWQLLAGTGNSVKEQWTLETLNVAVIEKHVVDTILEYEEAANASSNGSLPGASDDITERLLPEAPDASSNRLLPEAPDASSNRLLPEAPDASSNRLLPLASDASTIRLLPEAPEAGLNRLLQEAKSRTSDSTFNRLQPGAAVKPHGSLDSGNDAFYGELAVVHITNLLQSLALGQLSGLLIIKGAKGMAEVYFEQGAPVHANSEQVTGLECMLKLIGWTEGHFHFQAGWKSNRKTISIPLSAIILQGMHLLDSTEYLLSIGVRNESILLRTDFDRTEADFERQLADVEILDMAACKAFYLAINDRRSLGDIVSAQNLPRSKWVPMVTSLIRSGIVYASSAPVAKPAKSVQPKALDTKIIDVFKSSVSNPKTEILGYPAFLFLLEHNLSTREQSDHPVSLMVFDIKAMMTNATDAPRNLSTREQQEINRRVLAAKRKSDIFAHYEQSSFALLMPDIPAAGAAIVAARILQNILSQPMGDPKRPVTLKLAFGISSSPSDAQSMETLLAAAEIAKNNAWKDQSEIQLFANLDSAEY